MSVTISNRASALARLFAIALALCAASEDTSTAQEDQMRALEKQTQELMDAVSTGDSSVWDRYLDANVLYLSEDGVRKTKADLLREITPLPKGISGSITVASFDVRFYGNSRKIFLRSDQGRVVGFVDRREGRDVPWDRVE